MSAETRPLALVPSNGFVLTPELSDIVDRALTYLSLGYPVHFSGPAGTGKSTLAMHVAHLLDQPALLLHGNHEHAVGDLVGREVGFERTRVVDNYIAKVVRTDERIRPMWKDGRLTTACRLGHTLIYDEFNRSRPETNNALLGIVEDGMVDLGGVRVHDESFVKVHENFRLLLTSNPEEYAGTHKTQDALLDRVVTIPVTAHTRETEIAIASARAGVGHEEAALVVDIVREIRASRPGNGGHSLRGPIMLARALAARGAPISADTPWFQAACQDILGGTMLRGDADISGIVGRAIEHVCRPGRAA